jgi:hypothetical protein
MTQFHEGQEVEVRTAQREASPAAPYGGIRNWCSAKIVHKTPSGLYHVQFPDNSRAVFDAEHIRARPPQRKR